MNHPNGNQATDDMVKQMTETWLEMVGDLIAKNRQAVIVAAKSGDMSNVPVRSKLAGGAK